MKKKILILPSWYITSESPTSGSFFHEQSLLLENSELGIQSLDVQVITTEKEWISRQKSWFYKLFPSKIPNRFRQQFLSPPKGVVVAFPFCKYLTDEQNLQQEIEAVLRYFQQFPERKPDLIHAHCALKGGVIARYLSKKWGIPYLLTEHLNPFLLHSYSSYWKNEIIASIEEANTVLAVSEHQRQQLLMHELKCNPIVTGNLVDDKRFLLSKKKEYSSFTNFLIVTFYPNFIKDMETFFSALEGLKQKRKLINLNFTIVGGGELSGLNEKNYYQNKIKELNIEAIVTVVPKANREEMVCLMEKTDVLISTSIAESFGVAICEALLCGKPIISTLNGGVNDFLTDQNSIRIPIKNPKALENAIVQMSERLDSFDPDSLRAGIIEKYGRKAFRERMDGIYKQILEKS